MNFLELSKKRYSCRKFSDQEVPSELLEQIIQAGINAPTAVNTQPFHLFLMESEKAIETINASTAFGFGCKHFILVGANKEECYVRKFDQRNFADVDASIVATHIMMEIEDCGLNTTWVGHFDPKVIQDVYPETKDLDLIAIFPIGYAASDAKPSERHEVRKSSDELVSKL